MRIEQLEFLVEISKRKSFSSASEHLFISPQSLSRSVASMEEELQVRLFERSSQGVQFTREGLQVLDAAKEITERYQRMITDVRAVSMAENDEVSGSFVVYAHPTITLSVLNTAIAGFCKNYPRIQPTLLEDVTGSILERLAETDCPENQFGFVTVPHQSDMLSDFLKNHPQWTFVPLVHGSYLCCMGKSSPLAGKKTVSLKDVNKYPFVRFVGNNGKISGVQSEVLRDYGDTRTGLSTTSFNSWISAIEENLCVGLIHSMVLSDASRIRDSFHNVVVLPIKEKTNLDTGMLISKNADSSIQIFAEYLTKYLGELELK